MRQTAGLDRLAGEVDRDRDVLADEPDGLRVDRLVVLGLAAGLVDPLAEVAAGVEEADSDQRDAELGRGLEVIAGEDAEAAGVDRQPLVDAELHAEVRDEQVVVLTPGALPPADGVGGHVGHGAETSASGWCAASTKASTRCQASSDASANSSNLRSKKLCGAPS